MALPKPISSNLFRGQDTRWEGGIHTREGKNANNPWQRRYLCEVASLGRGVAQTVVGGRENISDFHRVGFYTKVNFRMAATTENRTLIAPSINYQRKHFNLLNATHRSVVHFIHLSGPTSRSVARMEPQDWSTNPIDKVSTQPPLQSEQNLDASHHSLKALRAYRAIHLCMEDEGQ